MNDAIIQYLNWLNRNNPLLYQAVYNKMQAGNLGATETTTTTTASKSWNDVLLDTVKQLAPIYVATVQQKQLNDVNLARAKAGQPPIDAGDAGALTASVGLSPATRQMILYSVVGIGAAIVIASSLRGGRRRR